MIEVVHAERESRLFEAKRMIKEYADSLPINLDFQNFSSGLADLLVSMHRRRAVSSLRTATECRRGALKDR